MTEQDITKTHTLNHKFGTVEATSKKYNYYIKEGCYLNEYSFGKVRSIISKINNKNEISIRFADIIELNKAHSDLVTNGNIRNIDELPPFSKYHYIFNKEFCVLTLILETED